MLGRRQRIAPELSSRRLDKPASEVSELASSKLDFDGMQRGMMALLKFIEHSRKHNAISEDTYYEVKGETLKKLAHIKKFSRQDEYRRIADGFAKGDGGDDYDTLDSDEMVESFIDKIDQPNIPLQRRLARIAQERRSLLESKKNVTAMLAVLDESYDDGSLSQTTYDELKQGNLHKLERINQLLNETGGFQMQERQSRPVGRPRRSAVREEYYENEGNDDGEETTASQPSGSDSQWQDDLGKMPARQMPIAPTTAKPAFDSPIRIPTPQGVYDNSEISDIVSRLNLNPASARSMENGDGARAFQSDAAPAPEAPAPQAPAAQPAAPAPAQASPAPHAEGTNPLMARLRNVIATASGGTVSATESTAQATAAPAAASPALAPEAPTAAPATPATPDGQPPVLSPPPGEGGPATTASGDTSKIELDMEKLKVRVDSLQEMRDSLYERISGVMENVGEIRSMVFSLDSTFKQQEAKTERFTELVTSIEPQRFLKELEKRDRVSEEQSARIEKAEAKLDDLMQNVLTIRSLLESIGSLRNIAEVNKDIGMKTNKMEAMVGKAERLNEDISNSYVELNGKISEFNTYRSKQDLLVESVKELVGMVENLNKRMGDYSSREDEKNLRKDVDDLKTMAKELSARIVLAQKGRELPVPVKELRKKIEGVKMLLASNEEEFIAKAISEEDYKRVRDGTIAKLYELEKQLDAQLESITNEEDKSHEKADAIVSQVDQIVGSVTAPITPAVAPATPATTQPITPETPAVTTPTTQTQPPADAQTSPATTPNGAAETPKEDHSPLGTLNTLVKKVSNAIPKPRKKAEKPADAAIAPPATTTPTSTPSPSTPPASTEAPATPTTPPTAPDTKKMMDPADIVAAVTASLQPEETPASMPTPQTTPTASPEQSATTQAKSSIERATAVIEALKLEEAKSQTTLPEATATAPVATQDQTPALQPAPATIPIKRGPGRPRKYPLPIDATAQTPVQPTQALPPVRRDETDDALMKLEAKLSNLQHELAESMDKQTTEETRMAPITKDEDEDEPEEETDNEDDTEELEEPAREENVKALDEHRLLIAKTIAGVKRIAPSEKTPMPPSHRAVIPKPTLEDFERQATAPKAKPVVRTSAHTPAIVLAPLTKTTQRIIARRIKTKAAKKKSTAVQKTARAKPALRKLVKPATKGRKKTNRKR